MILRAVSFYFLCSQPFDNPPDGRHRLLDLFCRSAAAKGQAQRVARAVFRHADGGKHMGGTQRACRAGRSSGSFDPGQIQRGEQGLAAQIVEAKAGIPRQATLGMPGETHPGNRREPGN